MRVLRLVLPLLAVLLVPAGAALAAPTPEPYGKHDSGGFHNVLPPGEGGLANVAQIAAFEGAHTYPPHTQDQLGMYANLLYGSRGLTTAKIHNYYKDATFGTMPTDVERTYSPRSDVTIVRDKFGIPKIYGATRAGTMFGAGYVAGEDRLFFIDALRHAGRAELSTFAGGANAAMDESVWADTPYTEAELQQQYDQADEIYGARGKLIQQDVQNYVEGVNQYIDEACLDPLKMPGEYGLIGKPNYPCSNPWKVTDVLSIGSLVAGIFGKGGGGELSSALVLEALQKKFGAKQGEKIWKDFRSQNDPEAPTTVRGTRFPYETTPKHPKGEAMPDPGSVNFANVVSGKAGATKVAAAGGRAGKIPQPDLLAPLREHTDASNALLVSGRESKSGHPLAVFGPQVSYFMPQILMEEELHAPAVKGAPAMDARGAAFPGTNLYVQLGHGRNYAWSATSAGQDIIDTYAVKLCKPGGGKPTESSNYYVYRGQCIPFDVLTRNISWTPNLGDMTPAGSETLTTYRGKLGVVIARATIHGHPYAYTRLRDTYNHEVDPSVLGFSDFNEAKRMSTPQKFMRSASNISLTFNWMYINSKHIAYFNSGQNPLRPKDVDANLPVMGKPKFMWKGFNPDAPQFSLHDLRRQLYPGHPHVVDQRYITSWNNKQAPGYSAADGQYAYGPQYRNQALDDNIKRSIKGPKKLDLPGLITDMEDAGTVDDRGPYDLPYVFGVIGNHGTAAEKAALAKLKAWVKSGSHRIDRNKDGHYDSSDAIRIIDAWWPRLVTAEFRPTLGKSGFDAVHSMINFDDPNRIEHLGSAFDGGWYGYVSKDLRTLLGDHVRGRYSRVYCGKGKLSACRTALLNSLGQALKHDTDAELYPEGTCTEFGDISADAQACADTIHHRAIGAITQPPVPWVNRPTFQQAVEIK
jgi:acyl-homoserine lactone acylase PvdQ